LHWESTKATSRVGRYVVSINTRFANYYCLFYPGMVTWIYLPRVSANERIKSYLRVYKQQPPTVDVNPPSGRTADTIAVQSFIPSPVASHTHESNANDVYTYDRLYELSVYLFRLTSVRVPVPANTRPRPSPLTPTIVPAPQYLFASRSFQNPHSRGVKFPCHGMTLGTNHGRLSAERPSSLVIR